MYSIIQPNFELYSNKKSFHEIEYLKDDWIVRIISI